MLQVSGLTKRYGTRLAVENLTFSVGDGRICGFLGHNGAGKSTTMNILTGCLAPTAGDAWLDGVNLFDQPEQVKWKIGYLPEIPPVYPNMTPLEYLNFVAGLKGIDKKTVAQQVEKAIEATGLQEMKDRLIGNLSKGFCQRVGIAQAILGDPQIIILDEPMVGLDPHQILEIRNLIRKLGQTHTVILSSHILSEIQEVCTDIIMIAHGKLVACDTLEGLEKRFADEGRIELTARTTEEKLLEVLAPLKARTGEVHIAAQEQGLISAVLHCGADGELPEAVFTAFSQAGISLQRLTRVEGNLEELFLRLTEEAAVQRTEEEGK